MSGISIAKRIYKKILEKINDGKLKVSLRQLDKTGKNQDDLFDQWFFMFLNENFHKEFEVTHSGALTTPDIVIRDRISREIIGIEVKKVDSDQNGKDSRGLTLDYNSCIPCGQMNILIGKKESKIKTFYFFGLLSFDQENLISSVFLDGDFLNYDFELHLHGKYANGSQYGHGPYGEGSVRGRAMYNYPNPLNVKLENFKNKHSLVIKENQSYQLDDFSNFEFARIERKDIKNNVIHYTQYANLSTDRILEISDIFSACKKRAPKKRTPYMTCIPESITDIEDSPVNYDPKIIDSLF